MSYVITNSFAQEAQLSSILLSNHSFSENSDKVGRISVNAPDISIKKISLKGEDAKSFEV